MISLKEVMGSTRARLLLRYRVYLLVERVYYYFVSV